MHVRPLLLLLGLTLVATACGGGDAALDSTSAQGSTVSTNAASPETPTTTTRPSTTSRTPPATTTTAAPPPTEIVPQEISISVTNGEIEGGGRVDVALGNDVVLVVTADVTDEVHLHTYDLFADVAPGLNARIEFVADIPGIIEAELEGARLVLVELEIR